MATTHWFGDSEIEFSTAWGQIEITHLNGDPVGGEFTFLEQIEDAWAYCTGSERLAELIEEHMLEDYA